MIRWLNPMALAGLALLALPVLIHLLRAHRAERVLFPSLRFVTPSRTAAIRVRLPSDWLLLLLRLAIVAVAVLAVARPVLVSASRLRAWNTRTARAVVVDTSAAMTVPDPSGRRPLDAARAAAAAESAGAIRAERIETTSLRDGLVRAAAWLATTPPARREVVVISAFTAGAFRRGDGAAIPADIGVRLVRVGDEVRERQLSGPLRFAAPGVEAELAVTRLAGAKTALQLTRVPTPNQPGLRAIGVEASPDPVARLWRTVAAAGAPAPSQDEPLACAFGSSPDAAGLAPIGPTSPRWMLRTLMRLQDDDALRRAAAGVTAASRSAGTVWSVAAVDRSGQPLVDVAMLDHELVMRVAAPAETLIAAAAVRALLVARSGAVGRADQEILRTPADVLAQWSRPSTDVDAEAWRRVDQSDGRWLWVTALILLAVEQRVRRSTSREAVQVRDAA